MFPPFVAFINGIMINIIWLFWQKIAEKTLSLYENYDVGEDFFYSQTHNDLKRTEKLHRNGLKTTQWKFWSGPVKVQTSVQERICPPDRAVKSVFTFIVFNDHDSIIKARKGKHPVGWNVLLALIIKLMQKHQSEHELQLTERSFWPSHRSLSVSAWHRDSDVHDSVFLSFWNRTH